MFSFAALTVACILGVTSATPLARQSTCSPDFEGAGVSIISGDDEWGYTSVAAGTDLVYNAENDPLNATAEWIVEKTGGNYIFRAIKDTGLVVGLSGGDAEDNGGLALLNVDSTDSTQIWDIECTQCTPGASSAPGGRFASGCAIKSVPKDLCASRMEGSEGFGITYCNPGTHFAPLWEFWTATSP
ncbi:hypothetical protein DFH06DRAFT_1422411 [Mycena polygramma]|nr:hypothetical protein DFH06DRAFT_1422411 [Mycena polygramma]